MAPEEVASHSTKYGLGEGGKHSAKALYFGQTHPAIEALLARAELTYGGTVCASKGASKRVALAQASAGAEGLGRKSFGQE